MHKQSLISLGTTVIPSGNKVQGLWKNFWGQTRRVMGDVQMADVENFFFWRGGGGGGTNKVNYKKFGNGVDYIFLKRLLCFRPHDYARFP